MSAVLKPTGAEYLAQERRSATKHEFMDGETFAMSGASAAHNLIVGNLLAALHHQLRQRPCRVYPSDMRVQVADGYVYPDVTVVCGRPQFFDEDNLLNPSVIIEVLSPSTAEYDASGKFARYRRLVSAREYLLVAQHQPHILHYVKQTEQRWMLTEYCDAAIFELPSIECTLSLAEVYEKVFEE